MKSEHRHELKTNELAEWIANFPQWAQKNAKTILFASIVIAATGLFYVYHNYNKDITAKNQIELTGLISQLPKNKSQIIQAQDRGIDISYMLIQLADRFHALALKTKDDQVAALALIKQAETLRTELHYRLEAANKQEVIEQLNRAKTGYAEALGKSTSNPALTAIAKLGIGLCEEELGNFDQARQIYSDITTDISLQGTTGVAQAGVRLETMDDYRQKVFLRRTPTQKPSLVKPQIKLEVPESNPPSQ